MIIFGHALSFFVSAAIIWFFAGLLIQSIDRVAKRFHQSGFTVAFFVLGFLTSISEISVMVNSSIDGVPQVSVGNLVGASFVILLGIVPFLAIVGKGIRLSGTLTKKQMGLALGAIALPAFFVLDGSVSISDGVISLLAYGTILYTIQKNNHTVPEVIREVEEELVDTERATGKDILKIVGGAAFIFIAGHFLVAEAVFFSNVLHVPSSLIGLLLLSIGTNVPELVIAVRSLLARRADIAFGDYLGSALTNTLIFGALPLINGRFLVFESHQFLFTAILAGIGYLAFYHLAISGKRLTRQEGWTLIFLYFVFVAVQAFVFSQLVEL